MNPYTEELVGQAYQAYVAGNHAGAEALLRFAVGHGGRDAHALYFIGHLCYLGGRLADAEAYLSAAIGIDPNHANARNDLGETLRALGRHDEAVHHLERAVALDPRLAHAYGNLAAALVSVNRPDEALRWAQESLWRAADKAVAHCDLGSILGRLGRPKEATHQYRLALALKPGDPRVRYYDALMRLSLGEWPDAWAGHECRLQLPLGLAGRRQFPQPWWQGESGIHGRSILLHAEQGLGDTIQFVRYVPLVAQFGATVLLEVQPGLRSLLDRLPGVAAVFERGDSLPAFDLQCSLMSLPFALRTGLDNVPGTVPYLAARPDRVAAWTRVLEPWQRMRVGLAWSGSAAHASDRARSIPLAALAPLVERADLECHVIQRDIRQSDRVILDNWDHITDHSTTLSDFTETAALISQMDLVITVDTSVAHLAGALGKPVWLLLAYSADWRWMLGRADTPWYPTMRLFRQPRPDDWTAVVTELGRQLDQWSVRHG